MNTLRVLIVDDDQDFAESMAEVLEAQGHACELVFSGEEAVRRFGEEDFDIAFMDVKLPGKNGVESFLEIRKLKPHARVVMMTGYSVEQLLKQASDNGALGILHKPIALDDVFKILAETKPSGIVLVVDDDPDFAESTEKMLTEKGYTVLVAHDGEEAIEKVLANSIDFLVLDLRLPVLSGLEVYLELKRRERTVSTLIVTGYPDDQMQSIDKLRDMSVTGCLVKPFDPADLLKALEEMDKERQ